MDLYQPRSFLKLVLIGFTVVALPLVLALVNAAMHVQQLRDQSERAVHQAVWAKQSGWLLVDQITAMERNARQYQVLRDRALVQRYLQTRRQFHGTAQRLAALPLDETQRARLQELIAREQHLYERVLADAPEPETASEFVAIREIAQGLLAQSNRLVDNEVLRLQETAERAQNVLMWQGAALVPVILAIGAVFALLISRPIRQIDQAIRRLGEGDFAESVRVKGPRDLQYLGARLDWLRRRLAELEAEKTKFLRHISHELKTPLSAIREGSQLLGEEVVGRLNGAQAEIAGILQHNCKNLQKLIDDMLNFNLARAQRSAARPQPVRLADVIGYAVADQKPSLLKREIRLRVQCPDVALLGDEDKLRVIFDNLLSNAIKYSPQGGAIEIAARPADERVVIDLRDEGPGIDPDDQGRIFEAFYQGKIRAQGYIHGSGLGLAIVREYVSEHGGRIEVIQSPRGAHFRIHLPCKQHEYAKAS